MSDQSRPPAGALIHPPPGDQPAAYTVPAVGASAARGSSTELIMLLSTLAIAAGIFLPFISYAGETLNIFGAMRILLDDRATILRSHVLFWTPPALIAVIVTMALGSWLALISPRTIWPALTLALSMCFPAAALVLFGIMSRLLLGAQSRNMNMGAGLILMLASDILLCVVCVLSLVRRR